MAQQAHRRNATWSGTIKDWLPASWARWDDGLGDAAEGEMAPLTHSNRGTGHRRGSIDDARVQSECTDSDGRPVLVFSLCRFPDRTGAPSPTTLLDILRISVEDTAARRGPYSAVLFLDPAPVIPPLRDLLSAYFAISHLAKKNVQHVYLVGGGWKTSLFVRIFSTSILSLKAIEKGKLVECSSLSQLADKTGRATFTRLEIPLEVYVSNAKREEAIRLGTELENTSPTDPRAPLVRDCLCILSGQGPASLGIFRRSPSAASVAHLEAAYRRGHPVRLDLVPDGPYLAASLLKRHLAGLPEPIFGPAVCDEARRCPLDEDSAIEFTKASILPLLSAPNLDFLAELVAVLARIADRAAQNLMSSSNLVICVCPALVGGIGASQKDIAKCRLPDTGAVNPSLTENTIGGVLRTMIEHFDRVFGPSSAG